METQNEQQAEPITRAERSPSDLAQAMTEIVKGFEQFSKEEQVRIIAATCTVLGIKF